MSSGDGVDAVVERLSRRTAASTTRRGFLGTVGRAAVLLAAGPTLATVLAEDAEARVCGQSGVAPRCASYDCDATWGWCWYASGCCAGGLLKKICDCCAPNTPNPRGYCPSGTRVKCIVESCGADPRLQTVPLIDLPADARSAALAASRHRFPGRVPMVVLGDAESPTFAALAASVVRVVEGPLLLTSRSRLDAEVGTELLRLGAEFATVVGPLSTGVDEQLAGLGITVERVGGADDAQELSAEVARWSRALTGMRSAVVVLPGAAETALPSAAALAAAARLPLLLGGDDAVRTALSEPRPVRATYVVTADAAAAEEYPGGRAIVGTEPVGLSLALGDVALGLGVAQRVSLVPAGADATAAALAGIPGVLLRHPEQDPGTLAPWLRAHHGNLTEAFTAGALAAQRAVVQSALNEFEAHLLVGASGEGLPVIPQPVEERPLGKARR